MRTIEKIRRSVRTECFSDTALRPVVGKGKHWSVSRLVAAGELERLRPGLFVFGPDYRTQPLNLPAIANVLYGPSYVSLEWALAFHLMIPERVMEVTSVNPKRTKAFDTPVGRFIYRKIPQSAFPFGVESITTEHGAFLVATKEKALLDKLYLDSPREAGILYCEENLRIEDESLMGLNSGAMKQLVLTYNNKSFEDQIVHLLGELKQYAS